MTGERESREELLEEIAELRYRARVLRQLGAAIIITGPDDGTILYTHAQFDAMFGYEPGELAGNHISIVNAPGEKTPAETADDIMLCLNDTGRWSGEIENIRKDGGTFWCHAKVVVVDHPKYGKVWAAVHEDITERKRAEEDLRESEERFKTLTMMSTAGIYMTRPDGHCTFVNERWCEMAGLTPEEAIREAKQVVGFGEVQGWKERTVERQAPFALMLLSLVKAWYVRHVAPKERIGTLPSAAGIVTRLRMAYWGRRISALSAPRREVKKFTETLRSALAAAA